MSLSQTTTLPSINPATLEVLGEVPVLEQSTVQEVVAKSWLAFETWRSTTYAERSKLLLRLEHLLEEKKDVIAKLISDEVGKPLSESYIGEVFGTLEMCSWLRENAENLLQDQDIPLTNPLLLSKRSIIAFEPLGVVGIISPWNYPFSIPMMTILMALITGNTVVLKPSEKSSLIGSLIGELFKSAGFPENIVSVITGDRTTGEYLTHCPLGKLIFTGSIQAGSKIMSQVSGNLTPVCLELGGKDPAIVLPDAPVNWTARGLVWGAFTNAGQACASLERLYLIKSPQNNALIEKIVELTNSLRLGPGCDSNTQVGPLIDESQFNKVNKQVEEAKAKGAQILCGGKRVEGLAGYFYQPTILTNVNHSMRIMQEETFGPVLPIMIVDSEAEAIKLANESDYGLTASVWSKNLKKATTIARELKSGTVFINDGLFSHAAPQLPWGGIKKSGIGRSHSYFGLLDLVNIKHIAIDTAGGADRLWWYPYSIKSIKRIRGGITSFHAKSILDKIKGLFDFVSNNFG